MLDANSDLGCSDRIQFRILEYGPWPFIGGTSVVFRPSLCEKMMCPMLDEMFSSGRDKINVMTHEAVHVLIRLGCSSGRASRSAPRRLMGSLNRHVSGYFGKNDCDSLYGVHHTARA